MQERQAYMVEMLRHIASAMPYRKRKRIKFCVRPNGSTDIAYEGLRVIIMPSLAAELSKISGHERYSRRPYHLQRIPECAVCRLHKKPASV